MTKEFKHKAIIIGGNFAGLSAARHLSCLAQSQLQVTLLDPSADFNWTPNIHEILSGVKVQNNLTVSRQSMLKSLGVKFVQEAVTKLDKHEKKVTLASGNLLDYDACIIACGYAARNQNLPKGHFQFRNAGDVKQIRDAIEKYQGVKKSINISIVGGGFTGVEALGELLRKSSFDIHFNITVLESAERLVKNLHPVISNDIIKLSQPYGVNFKFNCKVEDAQPGNLTLSDGSELASDITIWSSGGRAPDFITEAGLVDEVGNSIAVNTFLQANVCADCFVAGDIADVRLSASGAGVADQQALSKQSYHAIDLGKLAAQNMASHVQQKALQSFKPNDKPVLLAFGDINTYMISGKSVLCSPLLAATKEALYQVSMHKLMSAESLYRRKKGFFERLARSANRLLLPELQPAALFNVIARSRVLKKGSKQDLIPLLQGARSTLFDAL